jgi:UrcA family protein
MQATNPQPALHRRRRCQMSTSNANCRNVPVALALLAATVCLPLAAQAGEPLATRVVSYADLDLASKAGLATMYARIEAAAQDVCGAAPTLIELVRQQAYEQCVDSTVAAAVGGARSASLAALHASKRPTSSG